MPEQTKWHNKTMTKWQCNNTKQGTNQGTKCTQHQISVSNVHVFIPWPSKGYLSWMEALRHVSDSQRWQIRFFHFWTILTYNVETGWNHFWLTCKLSMRRALDLSNTRTLHTDGNECFITYLFTIYAYDSECSSHE
jgi:hypothetical protein